MKQSNFSSIMATTEVLIQNELGLRVPNVPSVSIIAGDSVTFTAGNGDASALYFSPATISILKPTPATPVSLPSSGSVTYTFRTAATGAYGVILSSPEASAPDGYDFGNPADPPVLMIQAAASPLALTPHDPIKT
jgi:hypothetical protein